MKSAVSFAFALALSVALPATLLRSAPAHAQEASGEDDPEVLKMAKEH